MWPEASEPLPSSHTLLCHWGWEPEGYVFQALTSWILSQSCQRGPRTTVKSRKKEQNLAHPEWRMTRQMLLQQWLVAPAATEQAGPSAQASTGAAGGEPAWDLGNCFLGKGGSK